MRALQIRARKIESKHSLGLTNPIPIMKSILPIGTGSFLKTKTLLASLLCAGATVTTLADETPQKLPFVQDWSNAGLIVSENDWSGAAGFMGYRGDKLAAKPGVNPQTITADGSSTPVSVLANQKNPNTLRTGGVAEFDAIPNPTVALKGSANAAAPMLVLNLDTRGKQSIAVGYKLRDLDSSANNAVQAVALQYRVATNTAYFDLADAFAPDATTGPGVATLVTPMVVVLPANANDQAHVQVRWITANAESNDEWVGIDDIAVIGDDITAKPAEIKRNTSEGKVSKPVRSPKESGQ